MLAGTTVMIISTKADLHEQRPENWDLVKTSEQEYLESGEERYTELPLLIDKNGYITISALENVGMEALKMEITRIVKDNTPVDPMNFQRDGTGTIDHIFSSGSIPANHSRTE